MDIKKYRRGTEIYYTGDGANIPGFGKIVKVYEGYYGLTMDIELEDGRLEKQIIPADFEGAGKRFILKAESMKERKRIFDDMRKQLNSKNS